jgi:hypothetical protein
MEASGPVKGHGEDKKADKAVEKALADAGATGTYDVEVTGTVEKDRNPQPTPIGDYKADVTKQGT